MADAGGVQIKALLQTPSTSLTKALEKLQAGFGDAEGLQGEIPYSATTAIEKLRTIYSALAGQIEEIDSGNAIKEESLAALDRMDIGLQALAAALSQGSGEEATRSYAMATRRLEAAGTGIDRAITGLR